MSWTGRGSNSVGETFSAPVRTGPGAHAFYCVVCTEFLSWGLSDLYEVGHPPHLTLKLKKMYSCKSRLFRAFVASCRVKFAFTLLHGIFISHSFRFTVLKAFDTLWSDILMMLSNDIPKTLPALRN